MNAVIDMVDVSTGEIIYKRDMNYAFNLDCKVEMDAGRRELNKIINSALRGSRIKNTPLSLQITFNNTRERISDLRLPFQPECDEIKQVF